MAVSAQAVPMFAPKSDARSLDLQALAIPAGYQPMYMQSKMDLIGPDSRRPRERKPSSSPLSFGPIGLSTLRKAGRRGYRGR